MRRKLFAALMLLAAFGGCRKRPVDGPAPDYEGTRQHSKAAHQSLDTESSH